MSAKLGSTDASFRLGAVTPAAVYLGAEQVWVSATVPGAPTISEASSPGSGGSVLVTPPESDGGSPITGYRLYINDTFAEAMTASDLVENLWLFNAFFEEGDEFTVTAVNAAGEGPASNTLTI